jgi:hypothetical protein
MAPDSATTFQRGRNGFETDQFSTDALMKSR